MNRINEQAKRIDDKLPRTTADRGVGGKHLPDELRLVVMRQISEEASALPNLDIRSQNEILGYGKDGLPN